MAFRLIDTAIANIAQLADGSISGRNDSIAVGWHRADIVLEWPGKEIIEIGVDLGVLFQCFAHVYVIPTDEPLDKGVFEPRHL
jgi:hypothetical protein